MAKSNFLFLVFIALIIISCDQSKTSSHSIDRYALVTRHNVHLTKVDTLGSLSVGNGEFAFTVDASGLQTFASEYENGISLGTQSQWGWHSMPSDKKYSLNDIAELFESSDGSKAPYAVQQKEGFGKEATQYLRANPHRLHLGLIGLVLIKENGEEVKLSELQNIDQTLDLWTGKIESQYTIEGQPVKVILYGHQQQDGIATRIESPLINKNRLRVKLRFPYGNDCHVCPGYDWKSDNKHQSDLKTNANSALIKRQLDSTRYFVSINWDNGRLQNTAPHQFEIIPDSNSSTLEFSAFFKVSNDQSKSSFSETKSTSEIAWEKFWKSGGAIDFSECTDPRAFELERRIVLSQYLTKIQCSGSMPPQETGLTMNSWFGKFHLEMHWWHAAHFTAWGRDELMKGGLNWYKQIISKAEATARWQGYEGARWPKMTDPYGNESPSDIGAFIIWQQPHPIYLAEQLYQNHPSDSILNEYKEIVFSTADFMASFIKLKDGKYQLSHPLIPAQEIFKPMETDNPTYELQYWFYGLSTVQEWRRRLGLEENKKWKDILEYMIDLPIQDSLYLPNSITPDAYTNDFNRRDHPAVVGAFGFLPGNHRLDTSIMSNTFNNIMNNWNWESTWGWDYPLLAMTATRLNKPEKAIDALMLDVQKNTYLVNGHNYQDKRLRLYLPGNGGLLAAVALMTSGWEGNKIQNPGFPKNGKWNVKWEGLHKMP